MTTWFRYIIQHLISLQSRRIDSLRLLNDLLITSVEYQFIRNCDVNSFQLERIFEGLDAINRVINLLITSDTSRGTFVVSNINLNIAPLLR